MPIEKLFRIVLFVKKLTKIYFNIHKLSKFDEAYIKNPIINKNITNRIGIKKLKKKSFNHKQKN
jgi:hypothetical protein